MQELIGKVIQFTDKIEYVEAYPEIGMRARIISVKEQDTDCDDLEEHLYAITFDYSEFDEYNKAFEKSNYYDRNGNACLTARQANFYKVTEQIYFGSPKLYPFEEYFTVQDQKVNTLLKRFKESGKTNYAEWLESQIEI